jgi:HD-GYP domain-containing protein (c-di-GMP phosphodiesterase class II)
LRAGIDLLDTIEFNGPVVDTLRQAGERWDGGGPLHLRNDAILLPARIIAVANAYVAMVSDRAHRPGAGIDTALAAIASDAGTRYDRRVTAALVHVIENRGGRAGFAGSAAQ